MIIAKALMRQLMPLNRQDATSTQVVFFLLRLILASLAQVTKSNNCNFNIHPIDKDWQ